MLTEAVFTRGRAVTADSVTAASPRAVTQSTNEITKLGMLSRYMYSHVKTVRIKLHFVTHSDKFICFG